VSRPRAWYFRRWRRQSARIGAIFSRQNSDKSTWNSTFSATSSFAQRSDRKKLGKLKFTHFFQVASFDNYCDFLEIFHPNSKIYHLFKKIRLIVTAWNHLSARLFYHKLQKHAVNHIVFKISNNCFDLKCHIIMPLRGHRRSRAPLSKIII